jgi:amino acid adenylation domain-containing protein/FkbM family methyltransferase
MNYDQLPPKHQAYLAERLRKRGKARTDCVIPKRTHAGPVPLSFAQESIWFASQLNPEAAAYNIAFTVPLSPEVTSHGVAAALNELAKNHEILRTEFLVAGGVPMQRVRAATSLDLVEIDRSKGQEFAERLREIAAQPFSITTSPLWRCRLIRGEAGSNLFVVIHHLIADGWSVAEMSREIQRLCSTEPSPSGVTLPHTAAVEYADFSVWQRQRFENGELEAHLLYWREKLTGAPAVSTLPPGRSRPATMSFRGFTRFFEINSDLATRLKELAQLEEASPFIVMLTAFNILLWRYSGQSDVVVGSPFACRLLPVLERVLGCFVNMLPLRTILTNGYSFCELVGKVKQTVLEAHAHEEYPFDRIVAALRPERSLAANPLFQTVFAVQNQGRGSQEKADGTLEQVSVSGTAKFDLSLVFSDTGSGFAGALEYSTDLFDAQLIDHFIEHYRTLLESVVEDPHVPIGSAQVFSGRQQERLSALNATEMTLVGESILASVFSQTPRWSDRVAIGYGEQVVSYASLRKMTGSVARRLITAGAKANDLIGICVGRSLELVPCILGTLEASCAYVPLDPDYPEERLRFMIEDADARVVITEPRSAGKFAASGAIVMLADEVTSPGPTGVTPPERAASGLAYMIYTSGSTGRPKGAKVHHRGFSNLIRWFVSEFSISADDSFLVISSFSFDLTQKNFLAPLCVGGRIVFLPSTHFEPLEIARAISREKITFVNCTPSAFYSIVDSVNGKYDLLGSLRWVILGGEPISLERLRSWLGSPGCHARIANTYGPTECSDVVAFAKLDVATQPLVAPVPIGRPVWNTKLAVVDDRLQLAPIGAIGELWITGMSVGEGYNKRPALNEAKFVQHGFEHLSDSLAYRTGDLVRYNSDEELLFVGRSDHQLKVRGFRVELEEIEHVLARSPDVEGAVVLARGDSDAAQLCAFVTPARQARQSLRNLMALSRTGVLDGKLVIDLPNGIPVLAVNRPETEFLFEEIWRADTYFQHGIAIGDGSCVIDVGANSGLFSLHIALRAQGLTILAFEPIPPLFELLQQNMGIHEVKAKCFPFGLGSRSHVAQFTYYPHVSIISGMYGDEEEDQETMRTFLSQAFARYEATVAERDLEELVSNRLETQHFECPLRTLSDVIEEQGLQHIDLLKVDTEKSELEVLQGIEQRHWSLIQQVVLEVHDRNGRLRDTIALLQRNGFSVVSEQAPQLTQTGIFNVYARRPAYSPNPATPALIQEALPASPRQLEKSLRKFAGEQLPNYMVPSSIILLEEFPTTPSGKVDRRALANLSLEGRPAYIAPRTAIEEELSSLWREILQLDVVGVDENFFELGGHSLQAAQLAARVRESFEIEFSVRAVFEQPSIAKLANHITSVILQELEPNSSA